MMTHNPPFREGHAPENGESQGLRFGLIVGLTLALVLLAFLLAMGQAPADEPPTIDAAGRAAVVDSLGTLLENCYVFPDRGKEMAKAIRGNLKKKKYDTLTDPSAFTDALTETMREITNDGHLWVAYSPEGSARIREAASDTADSARLAEEELARQRAGNFAFKKTEVLSGNIGYLKFNGFSDLAEATKTAEAAMGFLRNVDALIFDLRENTGGSPLMIQYLSSYLFDGEARHLNSFYWRADDTIVHTHTYPHIQGGKLAEIPVYILTSRQTFSAAEEFTYNLKHMGRATIVGDTTGGGAHPVDRYAVTDDYVASISIGRAINPVTGTNWEGVGIIPHVAVPQEQALDAARRDAMRAIIAGGVDEDRERTLNWHIAGIESELDPFDLAADQMEPYVGVYGPRTIVIEDGGLFYQRQGRPKYRMVPLATDMFRLPELEYFRLQFERDATGAVVAVVGLYIDGRSDRHQRGSASP